MRSQFLKRVEQLGLALAAAAALFAARPAEAQQNPECTQNLCGSPQQNGGGCGCGCGGSILYNYTDDGNTFSYSDDADGDGVPDNYDNCPFVPNRDQADSDGDGVGDACDNCPKVYNPDQKDTDGNGIGDACDPDIDGDGIPNEKDNCPLVYNPDQTISNTDPKTNPKMLGDACNNDIDGDGVPNAIDNCPLVFNPAQDPGDPAKFAAQGLKCSADSDGDGIPDQLDNCPYVKNPDQKMTYSDALHNPHKLGDACNPDIDGDGIPNEKDNCPTVYNPDQADSDRNGIGDACDPGFCLVVDKSKPQDCLDPNRPFAVGAGLDGAITTGHAIKLPLFANRKNVAIRYTWTVVDRPSGSGAAISNSKGAVSYSSSGFQYYYLNGKEPSWTPDAPGSWRLRLHGELVFDDKVFPGNTVADHDLVVSVTGNAMHNCSTSGATPGALILFAAAALFLRRKKRS
jgi:MYXO-CTERM domain-containing protein